MAKLRGHNLPKLKQNNLTSIKEIMHRYGPISRSEIAERLELTPPTITNIVSELIQEGLVEECCQLNKEVSNRTLGRKRVLIDFSPHAGYFIGIELGRRFTLVCVIDLRGEMIAQFTEPLPPQEYERLVPFLADVIARTASSADVDSKKINGIGISLPGAVNGEEDLIRSNYREDWNNRHLCHDLEQLISYPVCIDNNVRARAFGADLFRQDLLQESETFAYYFVAMGIACPLVIKNSMYAGNSAGAGEVGHMIMEVNGPVCGTCGNHGCLEAFSSERAILDQCRDSLLAGKTPFLEKINRDPGQLTIEEILEAQHSGDEIVGQIMQKAMIYLGISMANIINFINPHKMLVEGKILNLEQNRTLLLETTRKNLFGLNSTEVEILFVDFDRMSGAKGAAAQAIKKFFFNS